MHMPSRSAKFASVLFASFLAGTPVTSLLFGAARAADECLSGPKEQTPAGSHWYYRIDHASKRHCWYLREEGETLSQSAAPNSPPSAKPVAPRPAAAMQPSVADAHAELPAQTRTEAPDRDVARAGAMPADIAIRENSTSVPDPQAQRSIVAARWPNQPDVDPSTVASTDPAPNNANAQVSAAPRPQPSNVAAGPLAAAAVETPAYSAPMQLAALIGALALAGILGSVIFKFVNSRRLRRARIRRRRGPIWESTDDDRIVLSGHPGADALPRRTGFARDLDQVRRDDRVAEFFSQLTKRTPT
jgi:hypothetical protein